MESKNEVSESAVENEKQPILIIFKLPIGGLASYTPSKIQIGSTFELGVSRTAPPPQAPPPPPPAKTDGEEDEFLRPADETEVITWSAESTSDMLF